MHEAVLRWTHVARHATDLAPIVEVTSALAAGTHAALVGDARSGTDTLLALAAGIIKPDRGHVQILNRNPYDSAHARSCVGYASPLVGLEPLNSAVANLRFFARFRGWSRAEENKRIDLVLDRLELRGLARLRVRRLTGEQQIRLRVARAMLASPELLLVDEPLARLGEHAGRAIAQCLRTWHQNPERGSRTLIHVESLDCRFATDSQIVLLMDQGWLIAQASPQQLLDCRLTLDPAVEGPCLEGICRLIVAHPETIKARRQVWMLDSSMDSSEP